MSTVIRIRCDHCHGSGKADMWTIRNQLLSLQCRLMSVVYNILALGNSDDIVTITRRMKLSDELECLDREMTILQGSL